MEAQPNNQYNILIVDDSDFSRQSINMMLKDSGFNVTGEAAKAKDAIEILKDRKVDLVIIDVVMPEISGIELAQFISENFKNVSTIMISSLAQENIIIDSISAGASDYLQKPFTQDHLLSSIHKVLRSKDEF